MFCPEWMGMLVRIANGEIENFIAASRFGAIARVAYMLLS